MYKAKAKTRIVDGDNVYYPGDEIVVTKEQLEFLSIYLEDIQELKEDKPVASSKAKAKK